MCILLQQNASDIGSQADAEFSEMERSPMLMTFVGGSNIKKVALKMTL